MNLKYLYFIPARSCGKTYARELYLRRKNIEMMIGKIEPKYRIRFITPELVGGGANHARGCF